MTMPIPDSPPPDPRNGPVHHMFGLSYASYYVAHRTLLQSMPIEWQERFCACVAELNAARERAGLEEHRYRVQPLNNSGRFVRERLPHYRHAPVMFGRPHEEGL